MRLIVRLPRRFFSSAIPNGIVEDKIIPDCLRMLPAEQKKDSLNDPDLKRNPADLNTFHSFSSAGYNGLLAKRSEYKFNLDMVVKLHDMIKNSNVTKNVLTYNYMLEGYLRMGNFEEVYRLIFEMEAYGMSPDVLTFGVLMEGLQRVRGMSSTVEDLFQLMQARYQLVPTVRCWLARIMAAMNFGPRKLDIKYLEEMYQAVPTSRCNSRIHCELFVMAVAKHAWMFLEHMVEKFKEPGGPVIVQTQLKEVWDKPQVFATEESRNLVRFLSDNLDISDEISSMKLLTYASNVGVLAGDLAEKAIGNLIRIHKDEATGQVNLPKYVLQTYIKAMQPVESKVHSPEEQMLFLTKGMRTKLDLFTKVLEAQEHQPQPNSPE